MNTQLIAASAALFTVLGTGFVAASAQAAPPRHHRIHHRVVRRVVRRGHHVVTTTHVVHPRTHTVTTTRVVHHK